MNSSNWKKCNTWNEIKFSCENDNFIVSEFVYCKIKITIIKKHNQVSFVINNINNRVVQIINDLPENISSLVIYLDIMTDFTYLETHLTNLPFGLNELKFIYYNSQYNSVPNNINVQHHNILYKKNPTMKDIEKEGKFNILFCVKIPFDCKFIVRYENIDYKVNSSNNDNELELRTDENIIKILYTKKEQIYLTADPTMTFFKIPYRQYTTWSVPI